MELHGKSAIVTGGANGIGRELTKALAREGASVAVIDLDTRNFKSIEAESDKVFCIECDLTDPLQIREKVDVIYDRLKTVEILVNNAGILYSAPLVGITSDGIRKHDFEKWDTVIKTDLSSVFYMTATVVERMIKCRTKGVIVNISSVAAAGNAGQSAYSAAKAGVNALTATWAKELGNWNIRVAGVAPGYSDTDSTHAVMGDGNLAEVVSRVPLKRLGKADEVSAAILSVVKNDFFNGKILEIDGGLIV